MHVIPEYIWATIIMLLNAFVRITVTFKCLSRLITNGLAELLAYLTSFNLQN